MATFWQDVVFACRRLRRAPGFAFAAVATLALGIGATTAIFSHVNNVLFKTILIPAGERVAAVVITEDGRYSDSGLMEKQLRAFRARTLTQVEDLASVFSFRTVLTGSEQSFVVSVEAVTGNYFTVLEVRPRLGRLLLPSDDVVHDEIPVVISEHLWSTQFAADPQIVGQSIALAGHGVTVVGVVPSSFRGVVFPNVFGHDVWAPRSAATAFGKVLFDATLCGVIARLRPDVGLRQADAEVRVVGKGLDPAKPEIGVALRSLQGTLVAPNQLVGIGLGVLALSTLVFLIACANLVNLLLARLMTRTQEIAVRLSIGASRRHIAQLLIVEASLVTALGGGAGFAIAWLVTSLFGAVTFPLVRGIVLRYDASPTGDVFVYTCLATAIAAVVVGVASIRQVSAVAPITALSSSGMAGARSGRSRMRTGLVGAQVAGSIVLLVTAGLFARTALTGLVYDPGFDTVHTAIGHLNLGFTRYDEGQGRAILAKAVKQASGARGVSRAALASGLPTSRSGYQLPILPEGQRVGLVSRGVFCRRLSVSPGFFDVMGLQLRGGRDFNTGDLDGRSRVVIINEIVAATLWPGQNPIGKRLQSRDHRGSGPLMEVVGVVTDTRQISSDAADRRFVFVPVDQEYSAQLVVVVSGPGQGSALLRPLRTAMWQSLPDVPVFDVRTVAEEVDLDTALFRTAAIGLSALGGLALLMAVMGIYGVMAYLVGLRIREFGLRQALGATAAHVYGLVAREALRMLLTGVVPGLAVALVVPWLIPLFLVGVRPMYDWVSILLVPLGLVLVGLLACLVPARRAARLDPSVALRQE